MNEIGARIGYAQREENRCAQLLYFLNRLEGFYKISTGRNFRSLRQLVQTADEGIIRKAIRDIRQAGVIPFGDTDPRRTWKEMTPADMEVVDSLLRYSALDEFLLIRYDEPSLWSCKALEGLEDLWEAYGGLLQECRSAVVNIDLMEYAMLPFAKFRNLGEGADYSLDAVRKRIDGAHIIEFSEKLDGSMIQMRFTGDSRFWHGIMMATSGSLYPGRAIQLKHVLQFMAENGETIEAILRAYPRYTFIFEWIDPRDEHMVRYSDRQGLSLIGARDSDRGWMWNYSRIIGKAKEYTIPTTRLFSLSLDEALDSLTDMKGSEQEGYVLSMDGFLVKIKCPDFLSLMRAANVSSSFNAIVRYAAQGEADDFIAMLPESYREPARRKLRKLRTYEADVLAEVKDRCSQLPEDRRAAMQQIDGLNVESTVKGLMKAMFLRKPVEIIAKHRGKSVQYVRESEIDSYYTARRHPMPADPDES